MSAHRAALAAALICGGLCVSAGATAQEARIEFNLPAQPLETSLREVALRAGQSIIAPTDTVAGRQAPALVGRYTVAEAVRILLGGSGLKATSIGASFVIGQDETATATAEALSSDVVVTGSRIRGAAPAGSKVITIDREAIDRSGYATTQQIAQSIPQNFGGGPNEANSGITGGRDNAGLNIGFGSGVNLRGLGSTSTLVLVDGARPPLGGFGGVFSDLSLIPLTAVERIEVLPDGASAIYGADAVAGVVNVISRRKRGLDARLRFGTGDGNFNELQIGAAAGFEWASGRATIAYEYYDRARLRARDREYATEDLRVYGDPDYRSTYSAPGTIFAGAQTFAIPSGQNGIGLTPGQLRRGEVNRRDRWLTADLLPSQRRHGLFVSAEQSLTESTELFVRVLAADRRFNKRQRSTLSEAPAAVASTNPFYVNPTSGTGPVSVRYDFSADLGPETASGRISAIGGVVGVRRTFGEWQAELASNYGRQREESLTSNVVNTARLAVALSDPSRATAYNLFGQAGSTNPLTIAAVRGSSSSSGTYSIWSATAKVDGPLLRLPAGEVRLAFGGEHREERFRSLEEPVDTRQLLPVRQRVTSLPGERRIDAGYAELLIPLAGGDARLPLITKLDLSVAGRVERYSDVGTTTNPKIGLRWDPLSGLSFRGTYGTSFRAPSFNDLRQGPDFRLLFPVSLADPTAPGGQRGVLVLRGNDPDLGPEKATTWTLGADIRPAFLPGLTASATYFNIRYRDRIATPAADLFSFLSDRERFAPILDTSPDAAAVAALFNDPSFINPFGLTAADVSVIADARSQNLSVTRQTGLDAELGYNRDLGRARIGLTASATYLFSLEQSLTASAEPINVLGTFGFPSRFRTRASATLATGPFSTAATVNHVGRYRNTLASPPEPVGGWTTIDLQVAYKFPSTRGGETTMSLSGTNLLDRDPPYVRNFDGLTAVGFDPQAASPLGRVVSLEVRRTW